MGGSKKSYYHPDCWHTMQTVNEIKDLFIKEIDSTLTGKQIGILVSTVNNIVFTKKVDVDFVKFALQYFIKNKPGALKHPAGLHYIIQDDGAQAAWNKEKETRLWLEMKAKMEQMQTEKQGEVFQLDLPENDFVYKPQNKSKFSRILGV